MDINIEDYCLKNLNKINIILGKNGSGKSTLLRTVENNILNNTDVYGKVKYVTPERGGSLVYEVGIEQELVSNTNYLPSQRRKNQITNFKQQSVAQYKKLETLVLREFEKDQTSSKFDPYVDSINSLLDNIKIKRGESAFEIYEKITGEKLKAEMISSGESEIISLGIECLIFSKEIIKDKENLLFLDEPDVHLHPDLQVRLINFLVNLVNEFKFKIVIATHSTAILGALESSAHTSIGFMLFNQKTIEFTPINDIYRKILPIFGAHPLSNFFNEAPILLVEGEDDERIWQQVVRSSKGKIKLYPCSVGSVSNLNAYELEAQKILNSVYDNANGFSLRDRDESVDASITDLPPIIRMKLSCRNAESLLLADETLANLSTSWGELKSKIDIWLSKNTDHSHFSIFNDFKESGFNRKDFNIKEIRNDLMGIIESSKPWEIAVGQTIANVIISNNQIDFSEEGKILSFLGEKVVTSFW